ncbi:AAA family ATPase [Desulfothermobacter acidiphilus]|uniref:AAA family ATPase n=1 Tax=Desulfothermobacter acidiphilus TaxID=1938353 RepID=UPI003F89851F
MSALIWSSLRLAGFGCYQEEVEFTFSPGLNVYVADNERGKSTLVAGLTAVLFGLPRSSNPENFGTARFLHWHGAEKFSGALELLVGDTRYRLERCFENNRVCLWLWDGGGWKKLWQEVHNPGSQRRIAHYLNFLESLLGFTSRELFEATFCLTQPLPEGRVLGEEVQRLISGDASYQVAANRLLEKIRGLTRNLRQWGLGSDARQDRRLEQLERELEELRRRQKEALEVVEEMAVLARELEEQREQLNCWRAEWQRKNGLKKAWSDWSNLALRYQEAVREQERSWAELDRARRLKEKLEQIDSALKRDYPEWVSAPASFPEELDQIRRVEEAMAGKEKELQEQEQALIACKERRAQAERELQGPLAGWAERPRLGLQLREWQRLREQLARYQEGLKERERIEGSLAQLPDFALLGSDPVAEVRRLRGLAGQFLSRWQEFQEALAGYREAAPAFPPGIGGASDERSREGTYRRATGRRVGWLLPFFLALGAVVSALGKFYSWPLALFLLALCGAVVSYWLGREKRWRELEERQRRLAILSQSAWGIDWRKLSDTPLERLAYPAPAYAVLARLLGKEVNNLPEIGAWLISLNEHFWAQLSEQATIWKTLREEAQQWVMGEITPEKVATLRAQIQELEREIPPSCRSLPPEHWASAEEQARRLREQVREERTKEEEITNRCRRLQNEKQKLALELEERRRRLEVVLAPVEYELQRAWERYQAYREKEQHLLATKQELRGLLGERQLCDLERSYHEASNRASALRYQWDQLVQEHPGLPAPGEEGVEVEENYQRLLEELEELQRRLQEGEERERDLLRRQAQLEGQETVNLAQLEEDLSNKQQQYQRLRLEMKALVLAYGELEAAAQEYYSTYREKLSQSATSYFASFTGCSERRVEFTPNFTVVVKDRERELALTQLSRGAQDQLYLALRLALGERLDLPLRLPYIFDDCFANCDRQRRQRIGASLQHLAQHHQLLLLTHDPDFLSWGSEVSLRTVNPGTNAIESSKELGY